MKQGNTGCERRAAAARAAVALLLFVRATPSFPQKATGKGQAGPSAGSTAQRAAQPPISAPDQRLYLFVPQQKVVLPGQSQEKQANGTAGAVKDADRIGDLALVSLYYQNASHVDGRYNNNDFPVERGYATDAEGTVRFPPFRISPPRKTFSGFPASRHALSYRFPVAENHTVYRLSQGIATPVARIPASGIKAGADTLIREITVSELAGDETYAFVPDSKGMSAFAPVAPGVDAARVVKADGFSVLQFNYPVRARVFDTKTGFPYGPAAHQNGYSYRRQYHGVTDAAGAPGVVWQDKTTLAVSVTWFGPGLQSPRTVALSNDRKEILGAACSGPNGTLWYLTFEAGDGAREGRARAAGVYKAGADGRPLAARKLDTTATALNAVSFGDYVASLAWSAGRLGVMLGRTMHRSPDGLNHQGGIAVVLDADTLEMIGNHGQTSGHSFDSVLAAEGDGWFTGLDLGANYPRGVHLHRFNEGTRNSAVVYTFKTEHGGTAASPAGKTYPPYAAINGGGRTFYTWSNDNRTYTELGGGRRSRRLHGRVRR